MSTHESALDLPQLVRSVHLDDVRLWTADVRTMIRKADAVKNPQLTMKHGAKVIQRTADTFTVAALMAAHIVEDGDEPHPDSPVAMTIVIALTYSTGRLSDYNDTVLAAFAEGNATFNAWPYWREYIQSTAARMNLPPIVLPLFRSGVPAPSASGQTIAAPESKASRPPRRAKKIAVKRRAKE